MGRRARPRRDSEHGWRGPYRDPAGHEWRRFGGRLACAESTSATAVIIAAMRWIVTLSGSKQDVERLIAESLEDLSADSTEAGQLLLELHDSEGDESSHQTRLAAKADMDLRVRHINGFGKLRWGRNFEGVVISTVRSVDSAGTETQHVFPRPAYSHMQPRDFADMVERLGNARPALPVGLDIIEALDGPAVTKLAESNPLVGRVLHLVELMLEGDEQIDWVAGYSALEVLEHDLRTRKVDGHARGWWTNTERQDFRKTANSAEALGVLARHGKPGGVPEPHMNYSKASWYVRRVTAHWLTDLLEAEADPP
jgi:hypothetical protein